MYGTNFRKKKKNYVYYLYLVVCYLEVTLKGQQLWHSCCISKSSVMGTNGK